MTLRLSIRTSTTNCCSTALRSLLGPCSIACWTVRGVPVAVPVLSNDGRAYTTDDDGALHAEVGPGLLGALWRTMEERLPAAALTEMAARGRPRWESIIQALSGAPQRVHGDVHPALALVAALGLINYFVREHDQVDESWLRTAHWIGDRFDEVRLPAR